MAYVITKRRARPRRRVVRKRGFFGALGDALSIAATASSNPGAVEGSCSADGQFKFVSGAWQRLAVGEVCTTLSNGTVVVRTPGSSVGVTDTNMTCAAPPTTGLSVSVPQFPGVSLIVDGTEGTPIDYQLRCVNGGPLGLTRDQLNMVVWLIQHPMRRVGDQVDFSTLIAGMPGKAPVDMVTAKEALFSFTGPDGDTKNLFLLIGGTPAAPTFTFTWSHQPTLFQAIDNFITSISPFDPAPLLCKMLPMATKVPNPYVAAGAIVLQLSDKCPPSCPPGMAYDATAKTCSCPPGLVPNPTTMTCEQPGSLSKYLPYAIAGGAVLAAFMILSGPSKKAHHGTR